MVPLVQQKCISNSIFNTYLHKKHNSTYKHILKLYETALLKGNCASKHPSLVNFRSFTIYIASRYTLGTIHPEMSGPNMQTRVMHSVVHPAPLRRVATMAVRPRKSKVRYVYATLIKQPRCPSPPTFSISKSQNQPSTAPVPFPSSSSTPSSIFAGFEEPSTRLRGDSDPLSQEEQPKFVAYGSKSIDDNDDDGDDFDIDDEEVEIEYIQEQEYELEDDEDDEIDDGSTRIAGKRLPAEVRCFDTARIYIKGGDGGRGCVAFRREKYVPKGGPSGGNGGNGGNVWLEADVGLNSLLCFRGQIHHRAVPGVNGSGSDMHGANGKDLTVRVPPGTIVRLKGGNAEDPPLAEVVKPGDRVLLAPGGRGGRGNMAFKTSRNSAPALAEFGEKGRELWVDLELRLVADVGIVGVPNAGKSTLLSVLSAARPKVANYPFTTLVPNLGVCSLDYKTTVFADVPGLLEGAHSGVGLGHQFLRHCQRCRVLVHIVDGTSPDPLGDFDAIQMELSLFSPELARKPQVVAYNKMDVPDSSDYWDEIKASLVERGVAEEDVLAISAVTGKGVTELVRKTRQILESLPPEEERESVGVAMPTYEPDITRRSNSKIGEFTIEPDLRGPRVWYVKGEAIERFAQMTDWSYYEALKRFQGVLDAAGINSALKARGILEGDMVVIGDVEFEYSDDTSEGALYEKWYAERKAAGIASRGSARWPHATG